DRLARLIGRQVPIPLVNRSSGQPVIWSTGQPWFPALGCQPKDLVLSCELLDGTNGKLLWKQAVLGGELAVPCTGNPLQPDGIPLRGGFAASVPLVRGVEGGDPRNGDL